jgi:HK97 family phage major capsid protein
MGKETERLVMYQRRMNELRNELNNLEKQDTPSSKRVEDIGREMKKITGHISTEREILRCQYGENFEKKAIENIGIVEYLRTGLVYESRSMTAGESGGYLIPQSWEAQILEKERELFVMRNLADVQMSETDRNIPVADDYGESRWIKEGDAYPESDASFKSKQMEAYKIGRICKVSEELLQDNSYNLEQWLIGTFSYTSGRAMEEAYINGDGNGKPKGFLLDADVVTSGGTALAYDDLLKLLAALKTEFLHNATWLMNINTLCGVMNLKDNSGAYLYKPFDEFRKLTIPENNVPIGEIFGRPIILSSLMPEFDAGKKPIALGDFKRYRIHDRAGFSIQRLNEKYADTGFIGFRGMQRTDGKLLIPEAIKVLEVK